MSKVRKITIFDKLETKLQRHSYYRNSWWLIIFIGLFLLGLTAIPLGIIYGDKNPNIISNLDYNKQWYTLPAQILVYISYGLLVFPFLFLAGTWVSGINSTSRSHYFHFFLWIMYTAGAILILSAIAIACRAAFFS